MLLGAASAIVVVTVCGRYTLTTDDYISVADALEATYEGADAASWRPRYNVAPTDPMPVMMWRGGRHLVRAIWGLAPPGDKNERPAIQINARAETIGQRGMFRSAFSKLRVGVVADGFYEWTGTKRERRPIRFHRPDGKPMVLAGIAAPWTDPRTGVVTPRFAIITTTPGEVVAPVHDRMPAILDPADIDKWLRGGPPDVPPVEWASGLEPMLTTAASVELVASRASTRANDVRNDDPDCLVPPPDLFG